jgi:hypothetical protein
MYREIYMTGRTVAEHCQTIMDQVTAIKYTEWYDHINRVMQSREELVWTEPKPVAVICDHDREDRRTFEKFTGLGTKAAIKFVSEGIDLQKQRLKLDKNGEARFYVMADALVELDDSLRFKLLPTNSVEEYSGYQWKVSPDGRILDEPVKKDDHGMDTDRYFTMELDFKGKARVTMLGDEDMF